MSAGDRCWCGGRLGSTRIRTPRFSLLRCEACGVFRIDPPPIAGEEQGSDFYTAYYAVRPDSGPANGHERRSRFWRVTRQVPDLERVGSLAIDFGCGDGVLCHELTSSGWDDVVGIDVSRTRVARARRRYPRVRFYDRPIGQTDLARGVADLCVMDNVIEHLPDPRAVVADIRPYVRTSGRLVVITPNMESGIFRWLGHRWTPELAPHAHIFLFTAASLTRLLHAAGFEVTTVGSFQEDFYPWRTWTARLMSGDLKGAIWRAHQETGNLYSRITGAGPMLYAVAEPREMDAAIEGPAHVEVPESLHA
ncbi:MAG: class I SAM-dependent methyltransferase [Acidobacteria bacterium]|nr:class I SAM-dependent methyltransferase [Acidobacteriota bacterium]